MQLRLRQRDFSVLNGPIAHVPNISTLTEEDNLGHLTSVDEQLVPKSLSLTNKV